MAQRIIYKNADGSVDVLVPSDQALAAHGIDAIAVKDTPAGLEYWIVDSATIPSDRSEREAWVVDEVTLGTAHGVGGESSEF